MIIITVLITNMMTIITVFMNNIRTTILTS